MTAPTATTGAAVTSIFKAELLAQRFSKNSTMDESGHIILLLILPLTTLCLILTFLLITFSLSSLA